jgi:hypothetical protein
MVQSLECLATGWKAERSVFESQYRHDFILSTSSRPVLGSTQPPIQQIWRLLPRTVSGRCVKLTTALELVPR